MNISVGLREVEVLGSDFRPVRGWRFNLDTGVIDAGGEER